MSERHLRVYLDRSELVAEDGSAQTFREGVPDVAARERSATISRALAGGYLTRQIEHVRAHPGTLQPEVLTEAQRSLLERLVRSVTSEVGRALVGLTVLQLCVKVLAPDQSVRLHKGGTGRQDFSWVGGVSMRSLDSGFITPALRQHGLLKLNRDGFMMTRTLAENYPYSSLYKARIRGAKHEWMQVVEELEAGTLPAEAALHALLAHLINLADGFRQLADDTLGVAGRWAAQGLSRADVLGLMERHMQHSEYSARLMEVSLHALMQARQELAALDGATLVPLSQMRSANKKHGNIGDIETRIGHTLHEAWDAKYGKANLRDELEELNDKLSAHPHVTLVGFVTSVAPDRPTELEDRRADIEDVTGVEIRILTFGDWVEQQFSRAGQAAGITETQLAPRWLTAYVESLAQRRPALAPIDEPCQRWLEDLRKLLRGEQ